jgi:heterodisulfide reductase subunit A
MKESVNTAVFFGQILNGSPESLQVSEIKDLLKDHPLIETIWDQSDFPFFDPNRVAQHIADNKVHRIILVGHNPGLFKSFFTKAMLMADIDPDGIILVNLREYGIYKKGDVNYAAAVILCAVYGISYESIAPVHEFPVNNETLVIGGGIAGIQASLEIADSHNKVYLLEKTGTIGGHMAMFDKTFPTLDCAACILTPKMVEIGQHPFIEMITYSEVKGIKGEPGNFKVKILKKARRVDVSACIGCGTCSEKCPKTALSEFDAKTTLRKAIFIPFPQAVPNKYLIDAESCTYVQSGKCGVCAKVCPVPGCINLDEKDKLIEITVGNIIVATGFKTFDAARIPQFGYGKYPNVVTSIEFERLLNASGPTSGLITFRKQDKKGNWVFTSESDQPGSVAIIHCIGSRDEHYNKYCSRVCCMYSLKIAHLIREKLPMAEVFEYYIDMRAYGKGYEEFFERIKKENIHIIRGRSARVNASNGQLELRTEDIEGQKIIKQSVDMVVLAVGLEPADETEFLSQVLQVPVDENGWFVEYNHLTNPVDTPRSGIHIAGTCQGPKDIPDTVAQASAAASRVIQSIMTGTIYQISRDVSLEFIENKIKELTSIREDVI